MSKWPIFPSSTQRIISKSETSIADYLTDILEANDAALFASALGDIARARGMTEIAKTAGIKRGTKPCALIGIHGSTPSIAYAQHSACVSSPRPSILPLDVVGP